jgi:hypothetical protein
VWALAGPDLLDGLRGRRQLLVRAVTPVLLFGAVLGVALLLDDGPTSRDQRWVVAVEGDLDGARSTLERLGGRRIDYVATDDAALAVTGDAVAAVRVPDDLDDRLAAGEPLTVEVVEVTIEAPSRAAVAQLQAGAVERARAEALATAGLPADAVAFTVDLTEVELTRRGTRVLGAELVAAVVCLQAAMLVSGAANRFSGRRGGGLLVAQLVLPVPRRHLAMAKGVAELAVGSVAGLPVLLPTLLLAAVVTAGESGLAAGLLAIPVVVVCAVVLGACTTALGVLVGVVARTPEQVTLGSGAAVVASAVVAATVGLGDLPRPPALAVVPVAGVVSELRELLSGGARPVALLVALASTVLAAAAISALSGRALDGERLVLRAS